MVELIDCNSLIGNPLKLGSKGEKVKVLQTHLKTLKYYTEVNGIQLKIDGDYGKFTVDAVIKLQGDTGHSQDGEFGHKTCPDLNKKIQELEGIKTTTPTTQTTTTPTTTSGTVAKTPAKVNPYVIDTSKNVYSKDFANVHIQGLHLVCANLKRTNELTTPEWKTIELVDGSDYDYLSREKPLQYQLECYLSWSNYSQLKSELAKLGRQPCKVSSWMFPYGLYTVKVVVDDSGPTEVKLTIDLKQYKD